MKRIKKDKVKRGRIILSAILTVALAILSLGFGAYLGYITLNINYVTIGTMTTRVGGLLIVAGFFIFFGCLGGVIAIKELFIAHRNEDKFSVYKSSLISAIIFYSVIALISIIGIISSFISYVPSQYTWGVIGLGALSLVLSGGCFYCVFKELKEHKKKTKLSNSQISENKSENGAFNMNLDASEIHRFSEMKMCGDFVHDMQFDERRSCENCDVARKIHGLDNGQNCFFNTDQNQPIQRLTPFQIRQLEKVRGESVDVSQKEEINFVSLAEKLMQLEELRKAGLINDQEYQELKRKCI